MLLDFRAVHRLGHAAEHRKVDGMFFRSSSDRGDDSLDFVPAL
jgi:hypothetical protein